MTSLYGASVEVVEANGLKIAYRRAGDGPPLVLAHGASVDSRMWQPQLAALAGEFTVVAWDEPGAGGSSDVPADFTLADYADCLAALIEALGLGPAHVAGLSWGGTVVLELYRRHPWLVATLIMVDTYAGWKGSLPAGGAASPGRGRARDARRARRGVRSRRFRDCSRRPPTELVELWRRWPPTSAPRASAGCCP